LKHLLRNTLRSRWFQHAVGFLAAEYLRLVWLTNKFTYEPPDVYARVEPRMPAIFAFWHGQHFMTPFVRIKDSYRAQVRALDDNYNVALTADVPKRSRIAGLGIIMLARETGRPIMPFAMVTSRFIRLKNWDRTTINLPFGRGALVGIKEINVPPDADAAMMEELRLDLETTLNEATRLAYAMVGRPEGADRG
jgi:lysophospholipid acyltransferase (LPLAT)-like uncharacterized protein